MSNFVAIIVVLGVCLILGVLLWERKRKQGTWERVKTTMRNLQKRDKRR
jgi:hypothetical protein